MSRTDGCSTVPAHDSDLRHLRRKLGPLAWAVLADLLDDSRPDESGRLVALTNVRRLAANLGVSKDTAARGLRRLTRLGLIEPIPPGRAERGRFGRARYLIHHRDHAAEPAEDRATQASTAASDRPLTRRTSKAPASQPSLFDEL